MESVLNETGQRETKGTRDGKSQPRGFNKEHATYPLSNQARAIPK